jgi:O-antigen/teichoic acid export membrane protein
MGDTSINTPTLPDSTAASIPRPEFGSADIKAKTAHGVVVSLILQLTTFLCRTGSMVILARLLHPVDFGLVGMTTAFTGFLGLFKDFGLSMASVQSSTISDAQSSTLFWINLMVGCALAILCASAAPFLGYFYHQPQLVLLTVVIGSGFLFNGASAQHRSLLQRQMKFATLALIDSVSIMVSVLVAIGIALAGGGYWALVAMTVCQPITAAAGVWARMRWTPGPPQRVAGVRSMVCFGGTFTLNMVVVYLAYNAEKVLLGRVWGAEALGIYGRAYQLVNLPTENLNATIGSVAFPALARVQNDPRRLMNYFTTGYKLFLSIVLPITAACGLFAHDIIFVFLGAQWEKAVPIFRLLSPTIAAFAFINPFGSLMLATGNVMRSLKIALLIAPVVIAGYAFGLAYGPNGVALGYSLSMTLLVIPVALWAKYGTLITVGALLRAISPILTSVGVAVLGCCFLRGFTRDIEPPIVRLIADSAMFFSIYYLLLLFPFRYIALFKDILKSSGIMSRWRR